MKNKWKKRRKQRNERDKRQKIRIGKFELRKRQIKRLENNQMQKYIHFKFTNSTVLLWRKKSN
nr:hypothetical protein [Mycoplasmopsis bovis]